MTPQQPREDDAHSSSDDEAGTAFSDYVALDDEARRRPRDARPDAWTAPVLDDALQRRPIKPPPPPAAEEIPRPRPTSVRFVPQRPPCKSLRELALDTLSAHAELIPTDAVDALDEATAADVVRWIMAKQKHGVHRPRAGVAPVELSRRSASSPGRRHVDPAAALPSLVAGPGMSADVMNRH